MTTKGTTLASRVRVKEDVVFRDLEGEAVLLNLDSGTYFGLDPVGTRIWALLGDHEALTDVHLTLLDEFDVEPDRCERDLLDLVARLDEHGLVEISH
ncbi:PqqD family protein [Candidatus Zixiibacteriota bacterium]